MANASTIRRQVSGTQQLTLAPISNPGTTETNFALNNNALTLSGGGVIPLSAGVTGLYAGTGQVLHIRANGVYSGVTGGTSTVDVKVYEVPAAVVAAGLSQTSQASFNKLADTGPKGAANAAGSFAVDVRIQLDASGNLSGEFQAYVDGAAVVAPTVISSSVTGLAGEVDLNFVASVTLGGAEPSTSVITLTEFAIDLE